ncbi:DUF3888 domain-containing protein [Fredinandcohnia quinoae]|uniref:DUF3888 domain-containing protein n=1 Tax=Fredinandcohnia quinoae TaxID=2918902 RepID=A0AAW5E1F1_9BACI|nr:DUF3888 domain-containing protein [Fredinandcohnia sp. SECRCQ15]MCH1626731.1 DUF3888 domain-containing protein [Fredinandcohnia sp. SECRCQ15]
MEKIIGSLLIILFIVSFTDNAQANEQQDNSNYFKVDLTGYEVYSFGDFNQIGYKITPLSQLFLGIIQTEQEWIDEPRFYIKGNKGYFHLWKKDGTNVIYTIEKQTSGDLKDVWKIVDVRRKKINRIPVPKKLLKDALIERLVDPIFNAVDSYYGEPKLWFRGDEKVLKIKNYKGGINVTVQVMTFEGAHNPPYGEETITFQISSGGNVKVLKYKHRDIPENEWTKLQLR